MNKKQLEAEIKRLKTYLMAIERLGGKQAEIASEGLRK